MSQLFIAGASNFYSADLEGDCDLPNPTARRGLKLNNSHLASSPPLTIGERGEAEAGEGDVFVT